MKLRIVSILFLILLIAQMPMTVFAATVSLDIDKTEIKASQELEVSGTATDLEEVLIKIVTPNEAVYYMDVLPVKDGEFHSTIGFPTTANRDTAGTYTVMVGNDEIQDTTTVTLLCEENCDNGDNPGNDGNGDNGDNPGNDGNGDNGDNPGNDGNGNNGDNPGNDDNGDNGDNPGNDGNGNGDNGDNSGNDGNGNNGNNSNNNSNGDNGNNSTDNNQNNAAKDSEGSLPDTSTFIYNFLIIGLVLLVVGIGVVFYQRRKRA